MRFARVIFPFILFFAIFLVYISTLSLTIYGGDSGDFAAAVLSRSFAHPPGYPLYVVLGIVFNYLSFFETPAANIAFVSLLSSLGALYFFIKIILILEEKDSLFDLISLSFEKVFALVISVVFFAFNYILWLYSVVVEVFSLNLFIALAIFYFGVLFYKRSQAKDFFWMSFFIGLGFAHHHTFTLVLPGVFYMIFPRLKKVVSQKRIIFKSLFYLLLGFSVNLYIVLASFWKSEINWGDATTVGGFFDVFLRRIYGTFLAGPFVTQNPLHRLLQIKNIYRFLVSDFSILAVLLALAGVFYFFARKERVFKAFLISLFLTGPFFVFYANFPLNEFFVFATAERFFILFYAFFLFSLYFGMVFFSEKIKSIPTATDLPKKFFVYGLYSFLMIIAVFFAYRNYQSISYLRKVSLAEDLAKDILANMDENSIILLRHDTVIFNVQYYYYWKLRGDPKNSKYAFSAGRAAMDFYMNNIAANYPNIEVPEKKGLIEFIEANADKYNIYSNVRFVSGKEDDLNWQNAGLIFKLMPDGKTVPDEEILRFWEKSNLDNLLRIKKKEPLLFRNLFINDIYRVYSIGLQNSAFSFIKREKYDQALEFAQKAYELYPDDKDSLYLQAVIFYKKGECRRSFDLTKKLLENAADSLYIAHLIQLKECFEKDSEEFRFIEEFAEKIGKKPLEAF